MLTACTTKIDMLNNKQNFKTPGPCLMLNTDFHENINKQQYLFTNVSRVSIGFMITISHISSLKCTLHFKHSPQAVWDCIKKKLFSYLTLSLSNFQI